MQRLLKEISLAVYFNCRFSISDYCSHSGCSEHTAEACSAATDSLSQGSLRAEFNLQLASVHLGCSVRICSDMGNIKFLDLMGSDKISNSNSLICSIIGDEGQILYITLCKSVEDVQWRTG